MKKTAMLALAAGLALAPALRADIFYVPVPDTGGSNIDVKLQYVRDDNGTNRLSPVFIPTETSGIGVTAGTTRVDNDVKPNVFDASDFVGGPGLVQLTTGSGLALADAALFINRPSQNTAWELPVLTNANSFAAGGTAFFQNFIKANFGVSNLELVNLSTQPMTCSIVVKRPKGTTIGDPIAATLPALSHQVLPDILKGRIGVAFSASVRLEATCDRQFYAYGTFLDADDILGFRLFYPQTSGPRPFTETVEFNQPGNFFSPVDGRSELTFDLPLEPEVSYRKATVDFDVRLGSFTPIFTGIFGIYHAGGPRFGKTLYYGMNLRGTRSRALIDQGQATIEPAIKVATSIRENGLYHVSLTYDAENATTELLVIDQNTGDTVLAALGGAFNLDFADHDGNPVKLNFGLSGVADGAYYPPIGWRFRNLEVRVSR